MVKPNSHNIIITVLRLTNAIMSCPLTLYSAIDCSFVWLLIWKYCMGPQFIPEPFSSITTHTLVGDHAKISGKAPVMLKVYYNITGVSYQIEVIIYVWQLATKCSYMQNLVVHKRSKTSSTWVVRQWAVQPSPPSSANIGKQPEPSKKWRVIRMLFRVVRGTPKFRTLGSYIFEIRGQSWDDPQTPALSCKQIFFPNRMLNLCKQHELGGCWSTCTWPSVHYTYFQKNKGHRNSIV